MKKRVDPFWMVLLLVLFMAGCDENNMATDRNGSQARTVDEILMAECSEAIGMEASDFETESVAEGMDVMQEPADREETIATDVQKADIDLTVLSSTMVYSEVYGMFVSPEDYLGKTVKMEGEFTVFQDPNTKKIYFSCIVKDAMACCAQGLEFVLEGDAAYPEDYPNPGDFITVVGEFSTYLEEGNRYCTLVNAKLL